MDTVWHIRQCEGIICTLVYIYSRWNVDRCAGTMPERMFKIIYSSPYASHKTATSSHIVKYWYRITCPSIWKHNVYINVHVQSMKRRGTFDRIQWQDGVVLAVLSIDHTYGMLFCLLTTHTACPHIQTNAGYAHAQSIAYPSYIRQGWFKQAFRKTCKQIKTLVARGADTQLRYIAPLASNMDLWNPIKRCFFSLKNTRLLEDKKAHFQTSWTTSHSSCPGPLKYNGISGLWQ